MDYPPSVLIGAGDPESGPFYLIIANIPEGTTWHHVKDFVNSQADLKPDLYVNLTGVRMDSGWIRVIGYRAFRQVKSTCSLSLRGHVPAWHAIAKPDNHTLMVGIFEQNSFRGKQVVVHDPGYQDGSASVIIREPLYKDKDLFIHVVPSSTSGLAGYSMPPASHPAPVTYPGGFPVTNPGFPTQPARLDAAPQPLPPVPSSHNWPMVFPPHPPPAVFYPPEQVLYPPERAFYPPEWAFYPPERAFYLPEWAFYPPERVFYQPEQIFYPPEQTFHTQYTQYMHRDPRMSRGRSFEPRTSAGTMHQAPRMSWGRSYDPRPSAGTMPIDSRRSSTSDAEVCSPCPSRDPPPPHR